MTRTPIVKPFIIAFLASLSFSVDFSGAADAPARTAASVADSAARAVARIRGADSTRAPAKEPGADVPMTRQEMLVASDSMVADVITSGAFSGIVQLTLNGKPVFERISGFADVEAKVPLQLDTRLNVGSLSRLFTRVAIAQLAQEGKLQLSDPVGKYLPDLPKELAPVTIEQLVFHRGGVQDAFGANYRDAEKLQYRKIADYFPLFADKPLKFDPGTSEAVSGGGYILLGAIIEHVSGGDYYSYVRQHVFLPAGMTSTDTWMKDAKVENRARGYSNLLGQNDFPEVARRDNYERLPGRGSSASGAYSTAADLLRFTQALRDGRLLKPEWTHWMLMDQFPAKGMVASKGYPELRMKAIGAFPGADVVVQVEGPYTLVVLSNYDPPAAEGIARRVARLMHRAAPGELAAAH